MSPYELLDLALSLNNRIDNHWTLFITVHLALIGGLIYVDRPLLKNEKLAAVIIYTGFAVINFLMMLHQEQFLGSVYLQLFEISEGDTQNVAFLNLVLPNITEFDILFLFRSELDELRARSGWTASGTPNQGNGHKCHHYYDQ